MLQRLYRYYEDKGILSTSFACLHKKQCSAGSPDFTGPKSAFVSTGYENRSSNLPRLLFLSLDSGSIPIILGAYGAFNRQRNYDKTKELALGWDRYSCMIHKFVEAGKKEKS